MEIIHKLYMNVICCFEQILKAAFYKTADLQPPSILKKTIQIIWAKHAGHFWRSKDELLSGVLHWTCAHGITSVGRPARTYIYQFSVRTQDAVKKTY